MPSAVSDTSAGPAVSGTTYVLVPGGGGDPWDWHRVVAELESRGHDVVAVRLPAASEGAGLAEYAGAIADAARDRGAVVLVAHSLGGFSAPLACDRLRVTVLVLVNAMIPRPGESANEWWANTGSGDAQREHLEAIGISVEDAQDDAVLYFHDLPADLADEAARHRYPDQSMTPMGQPWPLDAWPPVPTRVVVGRDDRLFPASFQRRVARERLGVEVDEIDGGHMVALSNARGLVELLERYRSEIEQTPTAPALGDRAILSTAQGVITAERIFDAELAPEWSPATWPVTIAVGPVRLLLHWHDHAPGTRPTFLGRPHSIEISDVTFLGIEGRFVGIVVRDGSRYRFAFADAADAHRAEEAISASITAAGGSFTVR